jgi:hypothetical protein
VGEPSRCGGCEAGGDIFFVFLAGLAEVRVEVDERREEEEVSPLDDAGVVGSLDVAFGRVLADARDDALLDDDIDGLPIFVEIRRGIDGVDAGEDEDGRGGGAHDAGADP